MHTRMAVPAPGTLLAYFSGVLIPVDSLEKAFKEELGAPLTSLQHNDSRLAAYLERKSYLVALDLETDIDIPPELRDTKSYNATLGHKVNHWPLPNSYIGWGIHPRFGRVRAIVSLRPLQKGEEVCITSNRAAVVQCHHSNIFSATIHICSNLSTTNVIIQ